MRSRGQSFCPSRFTVWTRTKATLGFPGSSLSKQSACIAGDGDQCLGSGRCPREVNGNPLRYSCLENSTNRGAWWATVHGGQELNLVTQELNLVTKPPSPPKATLNNTSAPSTLDFSLWGAFQRTLEERSPDMAQEPALSAFSTLT